MMHFLSGLPRSGSAVLSALLNQRPDIHVTTTSGLVDLLGAVCESWETNPTTQAQKQTKEHLHSMLRSLLPVRDDGKITVDKSRGWVPPVIQSTMGGVLQAPPRIVATVRDVATCAASLVKIFEPDNLAEFLHGEEIDHLKYSYQALKEGYTAHPENILIVDYDEFMSDPHQTMAHIESFWDLEYFEHDFNSIDGSSVVEDDENAWGVSGLHNIQPTLKATGTNPSEILGEHCYKFQAPKFWLGETKAKKDVLDLQLEAALRGDFKTSEALCKTICELRPTDDRASFNRGWHLMRRGELLKGHKLLARGRKERVFGNIPCSYQPEWKQGDVGTVLLTLEGGLGDQIHGFRYANDLEKLGNRVALTCSSELAPMFAGQFITVQHEASAGVCHDFHVPAMSAPANLGYEYSDLSGEAYIERTAEPIKGRIGVRWSGNTKFEHEQHRQFPADLMFDAVRSLDCISLQRDEGLELKPGWMPQADVSHWEATRRSISECEKVITSCTSVAHLSAAMGIETWIVVPILPYYLWALPGSTTPYYDSVKLFRQETYGEWSAPFQQIKEELHCSHTLHMVS